MYLRKFRNFIGDMREAYKPDLRNLNSEGSMGALLMVPAITLGGLMYLKPEELTDVSIVLGYIFFGLGGIGFAGLIDDLFFTSRTIFKLFGIDDKWPQYKHATYSSH